MLPNLRSYMTVKAAAAFLGVSPKTLRYWDRTEKLKPVRHPLNRYRLYRREDLEAFLRKLIGQATATGTGEPGATVPS
jgi:MerR family transcriptional regulator, copper efflux regulator